LYPPLPHLLQYASFAGIVGVVVYAIASGIPILLIAIFGTRITRDMPHVFSLSDFMGWRFGPVAKTVVVLVALFNMSIALLAEYTTIGTIFSDFVGSVSYGIIIVIGVLTLLYTAAGGLAVSIATDQIQGIASALLALVATIYVAINYRWVSQKVTCSRFMGATHPDAASGRCSLGHCLPWHKIVSLLPAGPLPEIAAVRSNACWLQLQRLHMRTSLAAARCQSFALKCAHVRQLIDVSALLSCYVRPAGSPLSSLCRTPWARFLQVILRSSPLLSH
jgi:hypothetical protein